MSSSKHQTACEECFQIQLPNSYCVDCDSTFCPKCWSHARAHAPGKLNRDGIAHEKSSNKEVIARLMNIFTPPQNPEQQRKLHKTDAGSKWFGVTPNIDGALPLLQDYGRYSSIMRENSTGDTNRWPQLVSFVGQTGAGKSTIVKALIDYQERMKNIQAKGEFPSPVAGSANAHAPTSGDVHLYSDPGTYHSRYPVLYADCEGMDGGEKIPLGAQQTQKDENTARRQSIGLQSIHHSITSKLPRNGKLQKSNKIWKHEIKWANNPEKRKREFAVRNLYPRILYAFSDIVVFVLRNDRIFESTALVPLLQWADSSVESSINQSAMPHVIIVLNFADPAINQTGWTAESATDSLLNAYANAVSENPHVKELAAFWQERGKAIKTTKDLLHCYYSSVTVVRMPQKGRYGLVEGQITELSSQIERRCGEARENRKHLRIRFNAEEFQSALSMGFDHFSSCLDEPLDFVQISCKSNPIPEDFGGNILRLALNMLFDPKMASKTGCDLFQHLGHMVASCIMLDYVRHEIKGTHSVLLLHYKESYSRALKDFCEICWPCSFMYKGAHCVNTQRGHARGHQDAHGNLLYTGPYVSTGGFTEESFGDDWHKMLESNLDQTRVRMSKMMRGEIAKEEQSAAAELHLERINQFYSKLGDLSRYRNHAACFCCLREFPEHPLPCGHVLCTPCVKSFARRKNRVTYVLDWCPLHKHERWGQEWEIAVKPALAGVRILTLDGGGIRGIVELEVLSEIQRNLGQLQLASFFDLIVGTSTGGIIAIGIGVKNWSIDECIPKFEEVCSTVFKPRFMPAVRQITSTIFHTSKYKTKPFDEVLKEAFGHDQLFGGKCEEPKYQRKVAVVSTYGTGHQAVILTNYNRPKKVAEPDYKFERPQDGYGEMKTWEACRATSAAPTYFKPFHNLRTSHSYLDGALYYNNPARVAHQERKLLWPDFETHAPDILLSIGSSCAPRSKHERDVRNVNTRVYRVALNRFDNILDAQHAWDQFEQEVREPFQGSKGPYIRLNPELKSKKVKLDDVKSLPELKRRVAECLKTNQWMTETKAVARRLVASSFFFDRDPDLKEKDSIQGCIHCRFPDESDELRTLGRYLRQFQSIHFSPYFRVTEENEEHHGSLIIISKEIIDAMIYNSMFKVDTVTTSPSSKLARTMISLCLSKDQESFPISGFPRHLNSGVTRNGKLRAEGHHSRKQASDVVAGEGRYTGRDEGNGTTPKKRSSNSSILDLSNHPSRSSETLPYQYAEEDIPFWARGFCISSPATREGTVEFPEASSSNTEKPANISYCSPIDSTSRRPDDPPKGQISTPVSSADYRTISQTPRKSTQERFFREASPEDLNDSSFDHKPQMKEYQSKSEPRAYQSRSRGRTGRRDESPTPHPQRRLNRPCRPRSLQATPYYSTDELEIPHPIRTANDFTSHRNLDCFDNQFVQHDMDGLMIEDMAEKENLATSRVPTRISALPLKISIPIGPSVHPRVPQSAGTPTSFKKMIFMSRHESEGEQRVMSNRPLTPHHGAFSHELRRQALTPQAGPRSWQSPNVMKDLPSVTLISPCDITDMTEKELIQIATMRSLEIS
ncbi:hypothetical protein BDZ45DRAFT_807214 [Acephala macrosclerotiorum]|nr:hypothetical protein BDZ45DRAFT_807214 [Acephala macrosclerotiorum]